MWGNSPLATNNDTVMTRDVAAGRVVDGLNGFYGQAASDRLELEELKSRQDHLSEQLRQAIALLPVGSAERIQLEGALNRVRSLHPSQLSAELLNSISADVSSYVSVATSSTSSAVYNAVYTQNAQAIKRQYSYFAETDFNRSAGVEFDTETGFYKVRDYSAFARQHGFDAVLIEHVNRLSPANDPIRDDPAMTAMTATIAKNDPAVAAAQKAATSVGDRMANDAAGIMRHMKYLTESQKDELEKTFKKYAESTGLSPEEKKAATRFFHLARNGYIDPEVVERAIKGDLFNKPAEMVKYVEEAHKKRVQDVKAGLHFSSEEDINKVHELSKKFLTPDENSSLSTEEKAARLLGRYSKEPEVKEQLSGLKKNIDSMRGGSVFSEVVRIMDEKLTPAERNAQFYNKSPDERMELIKDLYGKSRNAPMDEGVARLVRAQVELMNTPEKVGKYLAAQNEYHKTGNLSPVIGVAKEQIYATLGEKAKNGDANAKETLGNLQTIDKHLDVLGSISPIVADRVRQKIGAEAYANLLEGKGGKLDYDKIQTLIKDETEAYKANAQSNGRTSEAVAEYQGKVVKTMENLQGAIDKKEGGIKPPEEGAAAASQISSVSPAQPHAVSAAPQVPPAPPAAEPSSAMDAIQQKLGRAMTPTEVVKVYDTMLGRPATVSDVTFPAVPISVISGGGEESRTTNNVGTLDMPDSFVRFTHLNQVQINQVISERERGIVPPPTPAATSAIEADRPKMIEIKGLNENDFEIDKNGWKVEKPKNEPVAASETPSQKLQRLACAAPLNGVCGPQKENAPKEEKGDKSPGEQAKEAVSGTKEEIGKASEEKQAEPKTAAATPAAAQKEKAAATVRV